MINITYDRNQNKTKVEISKLDVIKHIVDQL